MNVKALIKQTRSVLMTLLVCLCMGGVAQPAVAADFQVDGFTPVYAAGPDDNNHADQVPDTLKNLITHEGKTYVVQAADGRYIDVSLSFLKGRTQFNELYNSVTDARQKEALKFFSDGLWNYDSREDTSQSNSTRHNFTMIEHTNTQTVSFTNGVYFGYPITEDDVMHLFNSIYGYNQKSTLYTGANLTARFRVIETVKDGDTWGEMKYNYLPGEIGTSFDFSPIVPKTAQELSPYQTAWENEELERSFQHVIYFRFKLPASTDTVKYSYIDLVTSLSYITNIGNSASADYGFNEYEKAIRWNVQNKVAVSADATVPFGTPEQLYFVPSNASNFANFHNDADSARYDLTFLNTSNMYGFNMSAAEYLDFTAKPQPGYVFMSTNLPKEQKKFFITEPYSAELGNKFEFDYERIYRQVPAALIIDVSRSEKAPDADVEPEVANPVAVSNVKLELWNADHTQSLGINGTTDEEGKIHLYKADPAVISESDLKDTSIISLADNLGKINLGDKGILLNPGKYSVKVLEVPDGYRLPTEEFINFEIPNSSDTSVHEALLKLKLVQEHTISFNTNGGNELDDVVVAHMHTFDATNTTPEREGYIFAGWFEDEDLTKPYVSRAITEDITLYAQWNKIDEEANPSEPTDTTKSETTASIEKRSSLPDTSDINILLVLGVLGAAAALVFVVAYRVRSQKE